MRSRTDLMGGRRPLMLPVRKRGLCRGAPVEAAAAAADVEEVVVIDTEVVIVTEAEIGTEVAGITVEEDEEDVVAVDMVEEAAAVVETLVSSAVSPDIWLGTVTRVVEPVVVVVVMAVDVEPVEVAMAVDAVAVEAAAAATTVGKMDILLVNAPPAATVDLKLKRWRR